MKCLLLLIAFLIVSFSAHSQSYLGTTIKQVNFRAEPDATSSVIKGLAPGTTLFIISLETENDFYNVIDVATDREGFVHKSFIRLGKQVKESEEPMFTPSGQTTSYNPSVEIFNNTTRTMTLKLAADIYTFSPKEKRTITLAPGRCAYRASAPGVIPYIGSDVLTSNTEYSWQFYIVTTRR